MKYAGRDIPGQIEPIEQKKLEELAASLPFDENDNVYEFGAFLGRSTACIAAGLSSNESFPSQGRLFTYDSFECDINGGFYPSVISACSQNGLVELLRQSGDKVDFSAVFTKHLEHYIDAKLVHPIKAELDQSLPFAGSIGLMHIDSPKFYQEFKVILFRFFPLLRPGSYIVFQDFFYHWSATLIAACGILMRLGVIRPEMSAASSLICRCERQPSFIEICEIDLAMQNPADIPGLIDLARESASGISFDRKELFEPRLVLAKAQWLFENGNPKEASDELKKFVSITNKVNSSLMTDFFELMRNGFSVRTLYELDRKK
jgi:hypothetical protein